MHFPEQSSVIIIHLFDKARWPDFISSRSSFIAALVIPHTLRPRPKQSLCRLSLMPGTVRAGHIKRSCSTAPKVKCWQLRCLYRCPSLVPSRLVPVRAVPFRLVRFGPVPSPYPYPYRAVSISFRSVPVPFRSVPFRSRPVPCRSVPLCSVPFHPVPFPTSLFRLIPSHSVPSRSVPSRPVASRPVPLPPRPVPVPSRSRSVPSPSRSLPVPVPSHPCPSPLNPQHTNNSSRFCEYEGPPISGPNTRALQNHK